MQRWEYKLYPCTFGIDEERVLLQGSGEYGWELVAVVPHDDHSRHLYFKRPKAAEGQSDLPLPPPSGSG